jgi:hypothetical protein
MLLLFQRNFDNTPSLPHNFLRLQHRLVFLLPELLYVSMNKILVFRLLLRYYPNHFLVRFLHIYCLLTLCALVSFTCHRISLAIFELQCQLYSATGL